MTVAAKHPARAPTRLRHRRSARRLSNGQLAELRQAMSKAQRIGDDRGYQYWAGVHGLPLPTYCQHGTQLFLPWHRAYLYFFEKALQDQVPGVTLPWWDWRDHSEPLPAAYARARTPGNKANPLHSSPIQPSGRRQANEKRTWREPGDPSWLPSGDEVTQVRRNRDYFTFQSQLESLHNGVHGFVGGTMASVATSTYEARIFIGAPRNLKRDAGAGHPAYAGSFYVSATTAATARRGIARCPRAATPSTSASPTTSSRSPSSSPSPTRCGDWPRAANAKHRLT